jgi:tRNA threonylcarbamoyl adenosine modification protein YjeE
MTAMQKTSDAQGITYALADEAASQRFAAGLAMLVRKGDLILLNGDLGAGKTTIARAMIRALADDRALEVPSPTFTLVQAYDLPDMTVSHMDFYRIEDPSEIDELGLDEALENGVVLVEWPIRAAEMLPQGGLRINLAEEGSGRVATLAALDGSWEERLARMQAIDALLADANWDMAVRHRMPADASSRRYERLTLGLGGACGLLMDMPSRSDGPPVRNGLPYSRIAHLAEDIRSVEAINGGLLAEGYSAPQIHAIDMDAGLALVEDFGVSSFNALIRQREDIAPCLNAAVLMLAGMADRSWPRQVELSSGSTYSLQSYDLEALLIEAELCIDWYWPHLRRDAISDGARAGFIQAWRDVLPRVVTDSPVWVLRDFHVDNLFWLPDRDGDRQIGLIDTQDCVLGHPAYDLASLLQDVRVTIPNDVAQDYFDVYVTAREMEQPDFDADEFAAAYAILGAQRATKLLGIFARLDVRDGKPGYLKHLPRTGDVLEHNLKHPALGGVSKWFDEHLPRKLRDGAGS